MAIRISKGTFAVTGKPCLIVETPYHPDWPEKARALGGSWIDSKRHWTFDARDEGEVRGLCIDIYGTDGSGPVPTVDLEVSLDGWPDTGQLWFVGRELAYRGYGRVRFGEGVRVLNGGFADSGGRGRQLRWSPGTVLLVRDVPQCLVDRLSESDWAHVRVHGAPPPVEIPVVFRNAFGKEGL